ALAPTAVAAAALAPVTALALSFGDPGTEPFALSTLLPLVAIELGAFAAAPAAAIRLRATIAVYTAVTVVAYAVPSAVGSNVARLGTVTAVPLAALLWWRRRPVMLALLAAPLLYVGWQAPVRDVAQTIGDPSVTAAYYRPLLRYLRAQPGVFRVEIPLTRTHWEAWWVARFVPLARGWERQLDIADNALFYRGRLTAAAYKAWLHRTAVRFVALPDAALDYSARAEARLIRHGLPYLRPVMRSAHWRVYAVAGATPIATGPAGLTAMGPDALTLAARTPGVTVVRVRFSPYWWLTGPAAPGGCVAAQGPWTRIALRRPGRVRLVIRLAPARIGTSSPRCVPDG
ncbi:MAG TPA: hypothetical protein VFN87_22535, partial [Solirubrobacteraceae bacterium]|nr:hypothetical protein [Solirubrobacteraceae bacterium]